MVNTSDTPKRIAFVVAALTGKELQASQRDASAIFTILTDPTLGMCHPKESKLIHECRSKADFGSAIDSVLGSWDSSTQLIFYFSGHGEVIVNNYCFKFGEINYPFKNLLTELETCRVNRAILILDTCHSGAAIGTKNDGSPVIIEGKDISPGIAIIASSKKTQQSYELEDNSHSVFTSLLCEGINTGLGGIPTENGLISVSNIVTYIQEKLSDPKFSTYLQNPLFEIAKAEKDIWITKNKSGTNTKEESENYKDVLHTGRVQSYDELRILYEQTAQNYHPCFDANVDELDLELLQEYSNKIEPGFYKNRNLQEILSKLVLYSPILYRGQKVLHQSAVLCFHKKPHKPYPQARSIFIKGNPASSHFIREDICGPLSYQVKQLIQKVDNNIVKKSYIDKDGTRCEEMDIDISVVREMISNAITHRDYAMNGSVKIVITQEAVEVYNPGSFPLDKSWNQLLNNSVIFSEPTDAAIAMYLTNLLVYEGIGRGFSIFKEYIEKNGLNSLTCQEQTGMICIRLLRRSFPVDNIPAGNANKFVGREKELVLIHQHLEGNNSAVITAVQGMGGIGKTELATQYSLLHLKSNTYPGGIFWLQARDQNIGLQIIEFCRTSLGLQPPDHVDLLEQVSWCWQRWQKGNTLVVVDDVQNYPAIQPYLPPQPSQFKVLITTRLRLDLSGSLSLQILSEIEALALLSELVGADKLTPETAQAEELCRRLGYLPLALQLVGRYIKKRKISLAEMLKRLEAKGLGHPALVVDMNDPTWTQSITRGVEAAFALSWEVLSPAAQELGCLLSLFALAPIPWSLVESAAPEQDTEDLEKARIELERLHLLQSEDNCYQLHQLIREFLKKKHNNLASGQQQISHFCQTMIDVAQSIPEQPIQEDIKKLKLDIPHLEEVAEHLSNVVSDENLIWPFLGLGRFYEEQGLYNLAEPWFKQCVLLLKQRLGDEHPHVATSFNNLAELYKSQGRYSDAEPLFIQALALLQKLLGDDHPDVATSFNNLAELYKSQGRYSNAEPLYLQALALRQKLLGDDHSAVATSFNNLAALYESQGRYSEAEPLYLQALALRQKLLGDDHPDVATSFNNLALLYKSQGKYSDAEPLFIQALALWQKLLGDDHPAVATSFNNLALLYYSQGKYSDAEPLYIQALALRQKLLDDDHPDVATSFNNLAELYKSQGRYSDAEPLYIQALNIFEQRLGVDHPNTITVRNSFEDLRNR
jgi:tetratricopeptide (TPR) repeat protein